MFSLIACVGKNHELGEKGKLVFRLKDDMDFFRKATIDHSVLMGRKTWESLPSKLHSRKNIVVSRHPVKDADLTVSHLKQFIDDNKDTDEEIFVIGGGMIYFELLPYAKNIYLTKVDAAVSTADSFFPNFDESRYDKNIIKEGSENGLDYSIVKFSKK